MIFPNLKLFFILKVWIKELNPNKPLIFNHGVLFPTDTMHHKVEKTEVKNTFQMG